MFSASDFRHKSAIVALAFGAMAMGAQAASEAEFGPLFQSFKLTLEPGDRQEAVGPLWHTQQSGPLGDRYRLWSLPPLVSYGHNDDVDYEEFDFLWKVATYNRYGSEYRFQLVQWFSFAGGGTQSGTNIHRFTLFPLYFQQRSAIPEKNYTALLPIYGRIEGRFFRDEIKFALFPLYGQSRKKDVVTDNYLYPFFHLRHGESLKGWQFWPLFGTEHKGETWRTNHWGDPYVVGGHDRQFILWPFFHNQHGGIGTTNASHQQAFLPLYSYFRSAQRDSTTFPWPLGYTHTVDRVKKFKEWGAPWPLVVFARGEGKYTDRVWPFYSHAYDTNRISDWYLWPVYKYNRLHSDPLDRERTRILFFLYSDASTKNTETGKSQRRIDLWPLFTNTRDFEGRRRLQVLSPLEPILPNSTSIQRDLAPLWSLWRAEKNMNTGARSQSLLWNLYRRDASPESKKCSLLFGLFKYQSGPDGKRWRVLYVPFGKKPPAQPQAKAND